jgi:hypothetical protein
MSNNSNDPEQQCLDRFFQCIQGIANGGQVGTKLRRQSMIEYWCNWLELHADVEASEGQWQHWQTLIGAIVSAYSAAYDNLLDRIIDESDEVRVEVLRDIRKTLSAVWKCSAGLSPDAAGQTNARHAIRQALETVFDWDNNVSLRAFVYCTTGEALTTSQLETQKTRLRQSIDNCLSAHL